MRTPQTGSESSQGKDSDESPPSFTETQKQPRWWLLNSPTRSWRRGTRSPTPWYNCQSRMWPRRARWGPGQGYHCGRHCVWGQEEGGLFLGWSVPFRLPIRARVFWRNRTGTGPCTLDRVLHTSRLSTAPTAQCGSRPSGSSCKTLKARSLMCRWVTGPPGWAILSSQVYTISSLHLLLWSLIFLGFFVCLFDCVAFQVIVPWLGIKPGPSAMRVWSPKPLDCQGIPWSLFSVHLPRLSTSYTLHVSPPISLGSFLLRTVYFKWVIFVLCKLCLKKNIFFKEKSIWSTKHLAFFSWIFLFLKVFYFILEYRVRTTLCFRCTSK